MKYYAVVNGRVKQPTIFTNWDDCKNVIHRYSHSDFKSFSTLAEAKDYIRGKSNQSPILKFKKSDAQKPSKLGLNEEIDTDYDELSAIKRIIQIHLDKLNIPFSPNYMSEINGGQANFDFALFSNDHLIGLIDIVIKKPYENKNSFGLKWNSSSKDKGHVLKSEYCISNSIMYLSIDTSQTKITQEMIFDFYQNCTSVYAA